MTKVSNRRSTPSRRGLLAGGLGLAAAYVGMRYGLSALAGRSGDLEFQPLDRPAGFRRLISTGGVSAAGFDPFIGLDAAPAERIAPSCAGLFDGGGPPDAVPVAYFSDYNCAYCRVLSPRLEALRGVRITWHELPILGEGSVVMARAALAARAQGAQEPFHHALMGTPRPSPEAITRIVDNLDLDAAELRSEMDGPAVDAALARSDALAAFFGVYATPALIVGRTMVVGAIGRTTLDRLVAREAADVPVPACA